MFLKLLFLYNHINRLELGSVMYNKEPAAYLVCGLIKAPNSIPSANNH